MEIISRETLEQEGRIIHDVSIDIGNKRPVETPIHLVQYDNTLPVIAVKIYKDGNPYRLSNLYSIKLRWKDPNCGIRYQEILGRSNPSEEKTFTTLYFTIDVDMTRYYGEINPILELSTNGMSSGTSSIPMIIHKNPIQDSDIEESVKGVILAPVAISGSYSDLKDKPSVTATNLENGTGENSVQQKQSSKEFEFDNPNYAPTYTPEFGAKGKDSAVLNGNSMAKGELSTAEGRSTIAEGIRSHAEGTKTVTIGANAHAEGLQSIAKGDHSHAEGIETQANGLASHAEGNKTIASQNQSHAEGDSTVSSGYASHAEGERTKAKANASHSEGADTNAEGYATHAEGAYTNAGKVVRHGWIQQAKTQTITKTISTDGTIAVSSALVTAPYSISCSVDNTTKTITATITPAPTNENLVMVRIVYTISGATPTPIPPTPELDEHDNNIGNHAEGYNSETHLMGSHAEGHTTAAVGYGSHAEGYGSIAFGQRSHAEGYMTEANGNDTHASGYKTIANHNCQYVCGTFNNNKENTLFEIGNGLDEGSRRNAFEVHKDGHAEILSVGDTDNSVINKKYADDTYLINIRNGEGAKSIVSFGGAPHASGNFSSAIGYSNNASGEASTSLGYRTKATNRGQLSIGINNKNPANSLFDVGNGGISGSENEASSAFTVFYDGHAEIKLMGSTNNSVATKKYVDDHSGGSSSLYKHTITCYRNDGGDEFGCRFEMITKDGDPYNLNTFKLLGRMSTAISCLVGDNSGNEYNGIGLITEINPSDDPNTILNIKYIYGTYSSVHMSYEVMDYVYESGFSDIVTEL